MHLLRTTTRLLEEAEAAVDLGQSPADFVFLSFSDSDLGAMAAAVDQRGDGPPWARLASLGMLKHPYSVDLYVQSVAAHARFVLVRLLGGLDYWRYGAEELGRAARRDGFDLAIVPGDDAKDPRLESLSTLSPAALHRLWRCLQVGGSMNLLGLLEWIEARANGGAPLPPDPEPAPTHGLFPAACRRGSADAPLALIVFYRAYLQAGDVAPIAACAEALSARGARTLAAYVPSLKDEAAAAWLRELLERERPDVVLNATAFAARMGEGEPSPLEAANAPILQLIHAGTSRGAWEADPRGLGAADLAMHVVLPEIDGRIIARAISFKEEAERDERLEFTRLIHRPDASRIGFVADLALAWARLRRKPRAQRKLACVLSDYPVKGGRAAYAVGLDAPASLAQIAETLADAGYRVDRVLDPQALIRALAEDGPAPTLSIDEYRAAFAELPEAFRESVTQAWGKPEQDPSVDCDAFCFRARKLGAMIVAIQPDRARAPMRKAAYHDAASWPCHGYVAFYLWLRRFEAVDAMIQLGAHGTLEWLPGKAVALSADCAPEILLGATPLIYPFIVNNPGEAAQAKRRAGAVIVSHLTPPLARAGAHGDLAVLEALFDEYASAEMLDRKRAALLAQAILDRAQSSGLARESGAEGCDAEQALVRLDAWLCDVKEMRIGDGLHVFGQQPSSPEGVLAGAQADGAAMARLDSCAARERAALLDALDGRFVEPGPGGAPARGRLDVLPTGRNLFTVDPRAIPTRTAWEIGRRAAQAVIARHLQDNGDWPERIVVDLWGSATMRSGGEELAQIFAYLGATPVWDHGSARVTGFTILPTAALDRPRIDVTLRLSGLFRDVFPAQIAMIDQLIQDISRLEEDRDVNPLAAAVASGESAQRIFGPAPGSYGTPIGRMLAHDANASSKALGEAYIAASDHALGSAVKGERGSFRDKIAQANAFVHTQDAPGQDLLDSSAFAEHEGGFAAASKMLGGGARLYHLDSTRPESPVARTLDEELARVVRGRAANPKWIAGQMRHGYRGAAEIAETVDNLYAFAATTEAVAARHFELLFDAILGQDAVLDFLDQANPEALRAIAERFDHALNRGFWRAHRNSVAARLTRILERKA